MRYLLTGGAGFIGNHLAQRLIVNGDIVRTLDSNWRRGPVFSIWAPADVLDSTAVYDACANIDCCIHLAAINGTENFYKFPELTLRTAVQGTYNVLDACRAHKVKIVILTSSSEVYHEAKAVPTPEDVPLTIPDVTNPRFSYSGGKIMVELLGQHFTGIERIMVVRPHNIYGPDMGRLHVIPQVISYALTEDTNPLVIQGDGDETRGYCHVDDFIDGLMILLEKGEHRGIYNVGNDEITTSRSIANRILKILNVDKEIIVGKESPQGSPRQRCPDISKLRALGYEPKISLAEGLPAVVKWYREN